MTYLLLSCCLSEPNRVAAVAAVGVGGVSLPRTGALSDHRLLLAAAVAGVVATTSPAAPEAGCRSGGQLAGDSRGT